MLKGIADVAAAAAAQAEEESNAPQHEPLLQSTAPEEEDYVKHLLIDVQSHSRFFRGFVDDVPALAQLLSIVEYEEGETILQRGEEGTWVGLVLTGELSIIIDDKPVGAVRPGDFVGEMIMFFERAVRQATVVASRSGVIATVLVSELHELALLHPALSQRLMYAIGRQSVGNFFRFQVKHAYPPPRRASVLALPRCAEVTLEPQTS